MPGARRGPAYSRRVRGRRTLTLAVTQQARETAPVIRATLRLYPPGKARVVQWDVPDGRCALVEIIDQQRMEIIVPSDIPLASLRSGISELAITRDVWVVVAVDRLAAARRALRGLSVHLQSWWADGGVQFGRPEQV